MLRRKDDLWISILFLSGIAVGTCAGIYLRDWLTEQISVSQSLILLQISKAELKGSRYLIYLLKLRLPEIIVLFFAVYAGWYLKLIIPAGFCVGFWGGTVMAGMTFLYGIKGILVFMVNLFPHMLLYGFGFLLLYEFSYKRNRFHRFEQIKIAIQIFLIFAVGVLCEWWFQPILIKGTAFC